MFPIARRCIGIPRFAALSYPNPIVRRHLASQLSRSPVAFAFDIDGVLLQGSNVIPQAKRTLEILEGKNSANLKIPYILITNGGGYSEEERCRKLSCQLDVEIQISQLIQAHTIIRQMAEKNPDDAVLVLGGTEDRVRKVAEGYGFRNVYIPSDILAWNPHVWPFYTLSEEELAIAKKVDFSKTPFSSIFVFHDPRNWSMDIQIMIDIVRSRTRCAGTPYGPLSERESKKPVEVVFCNPDMLWRGALEQPRLGQGAFIEAFQAVYKSLTGTTYPYTQYGKPFKATYQFAERMLLEPFRSQTSRNIRYMIGGANSANWSSILVRTGVYDHTAGPPEHTPTSEAGNVEHAVKWALKKHGIEA
ncbi:hypothetical protein M422DRAFT_59084 [Sphaerobolus stellatus SS14]|nr:hypothetical protein M422DRAFT_59084 [Sphaerobolus stellatus SS14]